MPFSFWLFSRVLRPTDDARTASSKRLLSLGSLIVVVSYAVTIMLYSEWNLDVLSAIATTVSLTALLLQLIIERKLRLLVVEGVLYVICCAMLASDLFDVSATKGHRGWPYTILLIDLCLVCKLPSRVAKNMVVLLMVWFVVLLIEVSFRFGLYDIGLLPSQQSRREAVDCEELPCKIPFDSALSNTTGQALLVGLDFYFTRGFAQKLYAEYEKMNSVVSAAERIAASLSRFDIPASESVLTSAKLPPPLHDAFSRIVSNLEIYRPYLPDALFEDLHNASASLLTDAPPPGLSHQTAAIVFTDIQSSTAIWEACPEGMRKSLRVHNQSIRECISEHSGYEVKTIGDSFMVAFEGALEAVRFGLSVQTKLANSQWPTELLALHPCAQGNSSFCGLRVRVGAHWGPVDSQLNILTGRYDYFGGTVNKAARMESVCIGGAVAVTPEVFEKAGVMHNVSVIPMGSTMLNGIGKVNPYLLLPEELAGRRNFVEQQLLLKKEDRKLVFTSQLRLEDVGSSKGSVASMSVSIPYALETLHRCQAATAGAVELFIEDYENTAIGKHLNFVLTEVLTSVERTHGLAVSLQGSRVAVGWNTAKMCNTHVDNALAFVRLIGHTVENKGVYIGLSTSSVLHGTFGDRRQKFLTVLGPAFEVGTVLSTKACSDKRLCYYAAHRRPAATEELHFSELQEVKSLRGQQLFEVSMQMSFTPTVSL